MKKYLIVQADTNDGDYVTKKTEINDKDLSKFRSILDKVEREETVYYDKRTPIYGKSTSIKWATLDIADSELWEQHPELTEKECDFVGNYIPNGEYGVHTIESIDILEVANEIKLV